MGEKTAFDHPTTCLIRVRGRLDSSWADWFEGFALTPIAGDTLLTGTVVDQAALQGIITKLGNLGLKLRAITCREAEASGENPTLRV